MVADDTSAFSDTVIPFMPFLDPVGGSKLKSRHREREREREREPVSATLKAEVQYYLPEMEKGNASSHKESRLLNSI